ncbi:hypothetical protein KBB08_04190, partial [Candidatus Gracilibacteria bacterium]|nr:hypothetical protein [Candidatus Gracilibacteria bacterium]
MRYHLGEGAAAEELFPKGTRPLPVPKARQEVARNTIIPGAGQQPQDLAKAPSSGVYGTDDEQPIPVDEATESFGDVFEGFDDHAATPHHTDHYVPRISDVAEVRPLERTEPEAR